MMKKLLIIGLMLCLVPIAHAKPKYEKRGNKIYEMETFTHENEVNLEALEEELIRLEEAKTDAIAEYDKQIDALKERIKEIKKVK